MRENYRGTASGRQERGNPDDAKQAEDVEVEAELRQNVAAFGMNAIVAFWFAYVLTRPLGASFADWYSPRRCDRRAEAAEAHRTGLHAAIVVAEDQASIA